MRATPRARLDATRHRAEALRGDGRLIRVLWWLFGRAEAAGPVLEEVLGGELVGRVDGPSCVAVDGQAVHGQRVGDQVEVLALVTDRVGPTEEKRVVQRVVDRLGVATPPVEPLEVRVPRGDRPNVLGAVEAPPQILSLPWSRTLIVRRPR